MASERLEIIERSLVSKKIEEYELYLIEREFHENIFMKSTIETEREGTDFEYFIRILTQKGDETGIGVVKGNSLNTEEISKNIDICTTFSNYNTSSKYFFPECHAICLFLNQFYLLLFQYFIPDGEQRY